MALVDIEDDIERIGQRRPVVELPHPWLPNGYYTIEFPCGTHKTIRIHTQRGGPFAGKRMMSLLIGSNNTNDYELFGEIVAGEIVVRVWKRWQKTRTAEYAGLLVKMARGVELDGHRLLISRRCMRCNRELTTPKSIERGIGDECFRLEAGK